MRNKHSSLQPQTVWASISLPPCCDPTPVSLEMTISRVLESSRLPWSNLPHIFISFYHHPVPDHCSLLMNPYALLNWTWRAALEGKLTTRNLWLIWLWSTRCKSKQGARKEIYIERGPGEVFFGKTWLAFCLIQVCLPLHTCLNHFPYIPTFTFSWNECLLHEKWNFPFLGMPRKQEWSTHRKN